MYDSQDSKARQTSQLNDWFESYKNFNKLICP